MGTMTTVSMAVYQDTSYDKYLLGVAGIDVLLTKLLEDNEPADIVAELERRDRFCNDYSIPFCDL